MDFNSSHGCARRPAVRPCRGHALLELAIVKTVSLIFGVGIAFAIDPSIARMDGELLKAVHVDAEAGGDVVVESAAPAAPELETVASRSLRWSIAPRMDEEVMTRSMDDLIEGPAVTLVVP